MGASVEHKMVVSWEVKSEVRRHCIVWPSDLRSQGNLLVVSRARDMDGKNGSPGSKMVSFDFRR